MATLILSAIGSVLTAVGGIIALIASGGQLFDRHLPLAKRVTPYGWAVACLASLCLISTCSAIVSYRHEKEGEREKAVLEAKLDSANNQITRLTEINEVTSQTVGMQLKVAERQMATLNSMEEVTKYHARIVARSFPRHGSVNRKLYSPMNNWPHWYAAPEAPYPFTGPYKDIESILVANLRAAAGAAECSSKDLEFLNRQLFSVPSTTGYECRKGRRDLKAYVITLNGTETPLLAKDHETLSWKFEVSNPQRRALGDSMVLLRFGHAPEHSTDGMFRGQSVDLAANASGRDVLVQNHLGDECGLIWLVTDLHAKDLNCWVSVEPRNNSAAMVGYR